VLSQVQNAALILQKRTSCTERNEPFEGQTAFIEKLKVKAKDDKRPSQALDCSAGQI